MKASEYRNMERKFKAMQRMANALRDSLRWSTAALTIAEEQTSGKEAALVADAIRMSKSTLKRISSHRINQ
jgi:hypothetical protein